MGLFTGLKYISDVDMMLAFQLVGKAQLMNI